MVAKKFLKLFPPPAFLEIPYAGLDISDDAVRCLEYSRSRHGFSIRRFGTKILPAGVVDKGEIKDAKALSDVIATLTGELRISVVKASLPEEKIYLFKTMVPNSTEKQIRQNIEFKLEENVPISAAEAIFFFRHIPANLGASVSNEEGSLVSVSVAPRALVISYLETIKSAGLGVLSFQTKDKAIANALVAQNLNETDMIVQLMDRKTGIYIICGGVACFTSTIQWISTGDVQELKRELHQIQVYWMEHGLGVPISRIILSGRGALTDGLVAHCSPDTKIPVEIGNVWENAFAHDKYVPPISYEDSLDYSVAAGLALPIAIP